MNAVGRVQRTLLSRSRARSTLLVSNSSLKAARRISSDSVLARYACTHACSHCALHGMAPPSKHRLGGLKAMSACCHTGSAQSSSGLGGQAEGHAASPVLCPVISPGNNRILCDTEQGFTLQQHARHSRMEPGSTRDLLY